MKDRICMNPDCYQNEILTHYKCDGDRPLIGLAKTCWNCHKSEFLVDKCDPLKHDYTGDPNRVASGGTCVICGHFEQCG